MSGRRRTRTGRALGPWAPVILVLAALVAVGAGPATSGATGSGPDAPAATSRAVVVIDSGTTRTATCVRFDEPHISGLEALQRSGATVVHQTFGTMGGAVCSINGMGCPLTGCLTCKAPAYWNYFRAVGGGSFTRSGTGASTAKVRDGDVEGWSWGANPAAPPLPTVDSVCGARPTPPAPAPPAPAPAAPPASPGRGPSAPASSSASPGVAGQAGGGDASGGGDEPATSAPIEEGDATTTTDVAGGRSTDTTDPLDGVEVVDAAALAASQDAESADPPWLSVVGFAVLLAGLATWAVVVRGRRQATP